MYPMHTEPEVMCYTEQLIGHIALTSFNRRRHRIVHFGAFQPRPANSIAQLCSRGYPNVSAGASNILVFDKAPEGLRTKLDNHCFSMAASPHR